MQRAAGARVRTLQYRRQSSRQSIARTPQSKAHRAQRLFPGRYYCLRRRTRACGDKLQPICGPLAGVVTAPPNSTDKIICPLVYEY